MSTCGVFRMETLAAQRHRDRVVERQVSPLLATAFEVRSARGEDPSLARRTVPDPAAVGRAYPLGLDRPPEPPGALVLTSFRGDTCKETDAEDAAASVAHLRRHRKRLAGAPLSLVGAPAGECELGELAAHPHHPPDDTRFLRELGASLHQLEGSVRVPTIACHRTESP